MSQNRGVGRDRQKEIDRENKRWRPAEGERQADGGRKSRLKYSQGGKKIHKGRELLIKRC